MLNLPVIKPVTYVSPSAFNMWNQCEYKFYLLRLAGYPYVERKQTRAMAIGSAFDAFIKDAIVKRRTIANFGPHLDLHSNLAQISHPDRDVIINEAKVIAIQYIKSGFLDFILEAKEVWLEVELYRHTKPPILGKIDAVVDGIPLDWKLRGFTSQTLPSPTRGYTKYRLVLNSGEVLPEKQYPEKVLLESANKTWATQLTFYNWLLERMPMEYIIHEVLAANDGIRVAHHEGGITQTFSFMIQNRLENLWNNINGLSCDILEPDVKKHICEAYDAVCEVCDKCTGYMRTLGNAEYRGKFG